MDKIQDKIWRTIHGHPVLIKSKLNEPVSQHKKGDKVAITDVAIEKVQTKKIGDLGMETSLKIQSAHKEILKYSKEQNDSNEVACLMDLSNGCKTTEMIKGDQSTINVDSNADAYHMYRYNDSKTVVLCHNHPGLSYFSRNDIEEFLGYEAIKTMTIVTNTGSVWYIDKNDKYNRREAIKQYKICLDKYSKSKDWDKMIKEYLKVMGDKGIRKG